MHYYCKTFALIYACFAERIAGGTKSYTLTIDFQLQTRQY